jgi:predicted DNA-binding transcriptional regulator AlpA
MAPKPPHTQTDLFCAAEPDAGGAAAQKCSSHNLPEKPPTPAWEAPGKGALPVVIASSAALDAGVLERYLSDHEVGRRFEVSRATVWRWRASNEFFPQPIQISPGTTRWALSELIAFEAHMRSSSTPRKQRRPRGRLAQGGEL